MLTAAFFNRPTLTVARDLIGKVLVRRINGKTIRQVITETEAYVGPHDLASHSRSGLTKRNAAMFGPPGTIYVYFTYGMHWMLNIVTEERGVGTAVLIRGTDQVSGPARLTKALKIDKKLNGQKLGKKSGLWIEEANQATQAKKLRILRTPRIGIPSSGIWATKLYRFVLREKGK